VFVLPGLPYWCDFPPRPLSLKHTSSLIFPLFHCLQGKGISGLLFILPPTADKKKVVNVETSQGVES
jgi:hypothetical protein